MANETDQTTRATNVHNDDSTSRKVMDNPLRSTEHVETGPGDPTRSPFRSGLLWGVVAVVAFAVIVAIAL